MIINSNSITGSEIVEMDAELPNDVTGSRSGGSWYQNTSEHPMLVYVQASTGGSAGSVSRITVHVNSSQTDNVIYKDSSQAADTSNAVAVKTSTGVVVPPDSYYKLVLGGSASLDRWHEQQLGSQ